jgi:prolipoprotein diacylglyceryltransferase
MGLAIFTGIIVSWILVNLKLQSLKQEVLSKVNFVFIIFMIVSFLNGASMSYMHAYGLIMVYDLMAFSYLLSKFRVREIST